MLLQHPLLFEARALWLRFKEAFADGLPPCTHRNTHRPLYNLQKCWDCGRVRRMYGETFGSWHKEARTSARQEACPRPQHRWTNERRAEAERTFDALVSQSIEREIARRVDSPMPSWFRGDVL